MLTASGRKSFARMAIAHERWVVDLFSGLDVQEQEQLNHLLGHLKTGIHRQNATLITKETL
jgi:DNA-binding MarR family transcriptional regulator